MRAARVAWCVAVLSAAAFAADPEDITLPQLRGEAKARIQNVDQELSDWDIAGAKRELAALEALAPADVEPVAYYRGRIAFEEGRYAEAIEQLQKAGVEDRPGSWQRLVKDTLAIVGDAERHESEHFILLTPKGRDAVLAPWALDALEAIREALKADLGYAPEEKVRVEVVASAAELSKVSTLSTEAIKTTGTIAICKFNKLMITSPRAVVQGYDWLDTLAHEYTHLVVSRKSRNTVPIWLHEGLAKYLESRWRGPAGGAMRPSTLALLGSRVRRNTLVPFEKMHPSMALLPTAEDAATAFAEVYFAVRLIDVEGGPGALERLLSMMATGVSDRVAVERVMKRRWSDFEKAWMASLKKQPYPKALVPMSSNEKKELADGGDGAKQKKGREVSFGDFSEVAETEARRNAHLGELFRERRRMTAAAEVYQRAHDEVGDRYESISDKYALTLLELKRYGDAARVLEGSLAMHPGSASSNTHLGRIRLREKAWAKAKAAYLEAVAVNPFDPEVHVGLWMAGDALGDAALKARAATASALLLKIPAAMVPEVARRFAKSDDLADVDLEGEAGAEAPDAG